MLFVELLEKKKKKKRKKTELLYFSGHLSPFWVVSSETFHAWCPKKSFTAALAAVEMEHELCVNNSVLLAKEVIVSPADTRCFFHCRTSTSCATEPLWSTWGALITMQRNHSWTTALWYNSSGVHQVFLLSHRSPSPSCTEIWGVGRAGYPVAG